MLAETTVFILLIFQGSTTRLFLFCIEVMLIFSYLGTTKNANRMFPPTTLDRNHSRGFLYQLFRPEFLLNYKKDGKSYPLSSDAFSSFAAKDPHYRELNSDVRAATDYLFKLTIPNFIKWLLYNHSKQKDMADNLGTLMHKRGLTSY